MIRVAMLTYKPKFRDAIRTLRNLSWTDEVSIIVPAGEGRDMQRALLVKGPFPNYDIVEHQVTPRTPEGLVRHGALRTFQTDRLLRRLRSGDVGLDIDDDLGMAQTLEVDALDTFNAEGPRREEIAMQRHGLVWRHLGPKRQAELREEFGFMQFARKMSPEKIRERILAMAAEVFQVDERGYFTFAYTGHPNNALVKQRVPTRAVKWSGVLGFLPGSPNPFDTKMNSCEDWDAAGRALCDFNLPVIADPSTAFNMDIDRTKYVPGGALHNDRLQACRRIVDTYKFQEEQVFYQTRTALGQLPSLSITPYVIQQLRRHA